MSNYERHFLGGSHSDVEGIFVGSNKSIVKSADALKIRYFLRLDLAPSCPLCNGPVRPDGSCEEIATVKKSSLNFFSYCWKNNDVEI